MKKIKIKANHFISRYGLSLIIALLLGLLSWYAYFSQSYPKYKTKIFLESGCFKNVKDYYDLNNDGEAELLNLGNQLGTEGRCFLTIDTHPFNGRKAISQNNWDYSVTMFSRINVCDYDNDGIKEVFLLLRDDSVLRLIGVKPNFQVEKDATVLFDIPVTTIHITRKGYDDFYLYPFKFADINHDGTKEVIFSVNGGYSAHPRKVYYYDIAHDSLHQSPDSLLIQFEGISCVKANGQYYILPKRVSSPANVDDTTSVKYNDWSDWLYLFNQKLKPAFTPKRLSPGYGSYNYQQIINYKGKPYILSLNNKNYLGESLSLYTLQGKLFRKQLLHHKYPYILFPTTDSSKYYATILYGNELAFLRKNLKISNRFSIPNPEESGITLKVGNFDSDNKKEYLAVTGFGKTLKLFDDNFSLIFSYPLSHNINIAYAHLIKSKSPYYKIYVGDVNSCFVIGYKFNKKYYLSFLFAAITSFILFVLFQLAIRQRLRFIERQNNLEKLLIESQLKIANQQMNPHFQLNILNSISYLFTKDREKAQYLLNKYSNLVIQTIRDADKISTTLQNELKFTENYLILERHRLENKFNFTFEINDNVDTSVTVPRLLIFTFAENAVKHGLFHKESQGFLVIKGFQKTKEIVITIEDNGIGREKARKIKTTGTGIGLATIEKIIDYFNKNGKSYITYSLYDKKKEPGLKVVITIST